MKSALIVESGVIGEDGKLRVPPERLMQFYFEHRGERVLVKIEALEPHATAATFRYYFGYVVPTIRQAFAKLGELMTEKAVHAFLWKEYPGEHNPLDDIREVPRSQVYGFLHWLKVYSAENFGVYVEDPTNL